MYVRNKNAFSFYLLNLIVLNYIIEFLIQENKFGLLWSYILKVINFRGLHNLTLTLQIHPNPNSNEVI